MSKNIIVITGGPGTGKTTIIDGLIEQGYTCFSEISRDIINEARKKGIEQLFLEKPLLFSELLLEGRKKQFLDASTINEPIIFLDRGIPDILAYMHYIGDSYPAFFDENCKQNRYTKVFLLPPWESIYVSDKDRYENFEQAKLIYTHLKETYENYGYDLIEVPQGDLNSRILFILEAIAQ
ncbi:ATP-binding protein [Flavobacterium sp.]|uniref:ATP-binding protein n=1 Tax=Flavobacterium sp. TaxID=239 RepID=UPI002633FF20|nr:ATP-binding protein [Flavobacterium sp.]MDD2986540.1 ATP-binding protein [Flavobacterium sp.]